MSPSEPPSCPAGTIVFLIPAGTYFPSGVRRVLDYLPELRKRGWACEVFSYSSPLLLRLYERFRRPPWSVFKIFARKAVALCNLFCNAGSLLWVLSAARRADIVFVQQVPPPVWFTKRLARQAVHIVYDIDDAVFLHYPERAIAMARAAHIVIAGSHYNAEFGEKHARVTVFLPTPVPLDQFLRLARPRPSSPSEAVRIGWGGSDSTVTQLAVIQKPLAELAERLPGRARFVVAGLSERWDLIPSFDPMPVEVVPRVPIDQVASVVTGFDIGVMPLRDGDWERGKCAAKALECMAAGVPTVCSAVGENNYVIRDGEDGFLAHGPAEWSEKLARLITNGDLRARIGRAGQETVRSRYSTEVCFGVLLERVLEPLGPRRGVPTGET